MIVLLLPLAALGGIARWFVAAKLNRSTLPVGTLVANLSAAFAVGALSAVRGTSDAVVRIGLFGALSTWSTLAGEVTGLARQGHRRTALGYLAGSVLGGIAAAWLGLQIANT